MEIATSLKTFLGEKLTNVVGKGVDKVYEEIEYICNNNILEYLAEEYKRNFYTKTIIHRTNPVELLNIYQPLFIRKSEGYIRKSTSYGDHRKVGTDNVEELFKNISKIGLIGNAGSGKSTIVKYLFVNSIAKNYKIPIRIELRYLNAYPYKLIDYIKNEIFKFQELVNNDRIIERLMKSGCFLFFLDGYDEIASTKKEQITKQIDDFAKKYSKNNYMLTSRPFTGIESFPDFCMYEVCELSNRDIDEFIKKQIKEKELSDKIIEAVHNEENASYKSFLSNPLLLSMFILTFQSYSSIPQKRSEFYRQVFETLFSYHDSVSKMAYVREKQSGLSKDNFIDVLKLFSFLSYFKQEYIFTRESIDEKFNEIKKRKKDLCFDNEKLLEDLTVAISILAIEGSEYTFPHRSLQEYFAALYIANLSDSNKSLVYQKISESLSTREFNGSMRETGNFYLLLSELDKFSVIRYAICPFLTQVQKEITNIDIVDWERIEKLFFNIKLFYVTFDSILNKNDICIKFRECQNYYVENFKPSKSKDGRNSKVNENILRKDIANNYIFPFLKEFYSTIQETKELLENKLKENEKIDCLFIDLI